MEALLLFIRLIFAPLWLAVMLLCAVFLTVYAGIGWIFTGSAHINMSWPDWR